MKMAVDLMDITLQIMAPHMYNIIQEKVIMEKGHIIKYLQEMYLHIQAN